MPDEVICYAFEVLGVTVVQLERRYGPAEDDPRWVKHEEERCELCQITEAQTAV
jgi:hypothetical protein